MADTGRCGAVGDRGEIGSGVALAAGAGIKLWLTTVAGAVPAAVTGGTGKLETMLYEMIQIQINTQELGNLYFFTGLLT